MLRRKVFGTVMVLSLVLFAAFSSNSAETQINKTRPVMQPSAPAENLRLPRDDFKTGPVVQPSVPAEDFLLPKGEGKIASVTVLPGDVWRTGATVKIQWAWPGYASSPADVTLGPGSGSSFQPWYTLASRNTKGEAGWEVPYSFRAGTYTVRVQSSQNNKNFTETAVRVEYSTLKIVSPQAGQKLIPGSPVQVIWSFQGRPGPLKLELAGGGTYLVMSNLPWGSSAAGQYTWTVPPDFVGDRPCRLRLTSMLSPNITATSETFIITGPSITITQPNPGSTVQQGMTIPITWTYRGNIGNAVKVKVLPKDGLMLDFEIQTPAGSNGQGRFDGWKPRPSANTQYYAVWVESIQNPGIYNQIATPLVVPGSSLVHGASAAPNPNSTLTAADVTFFTTSDGKTLENCLSLVLFDKNGKQVASRDKSYCGAPDSNSAFVPNSMVTIDLRYIDKTATRSSFDNIKLQVALYAIWEDDTWRFKPKVVLYFSDGSTLTKESGEQSITAEGADMFTGLFDGNTTFPPGIATITYWQ